MAAVWLSQDVCWVVPVPAGWPDWETPVVLIQRAGTALMNPCAPAPGLKYSGMAFRQHQRNPRLHKYHKTFNYWDFCLR